MSEEIKSLWCSRKGQRCCRDLLWSSTGFYKWLFLFYVGKKFNSRWLSWRFFAKIGTSKEHTLDFAHWYRLDCFAKAKKPALSCFCANWISAKLSTNLSYYWLTVHYLPTCVLARQNGPIALLLRTVLTTTSLPLPRLSDRVSHERPHPLHCLIRTSVADSVQVQSLQAITSSQSDGGIDNSWVWELLAIAHAIASGTHNFKPCGND